MPSKTEFQEKLDSSWEEVLPGKNSLPLSDVKQMLEEVGIRLPNHKVRDILGELRETGETQGDFLPKPAFEKLCQNLTSEDVAKTFTTTKQHDKNAEKHESEKNYGYHTVLDEEQVAFADWINDQLRYDEDVKHKLPLKPDGSDMYEKMDDGILLCKMINMAAPDTIDDRAINKGKNISIFKQHENLTLARNSASSIGIVVIGIDSHTLNSGQGKKWLVLGLIWQLIKMYLFKQITIQQVPGLINLLRDGEELADLMKLSPEQLLLRWVNYQLEKAGSDRRAHNFSGDIKDSEIYTELLAQVAPADAGVNKFAMKKENLEERAEIMLEQAEKIHCRAFLTPKDVVKGNDKLNLAFVANLFNTHPGLEPPEELDYEEIQETREEKMYRNWMNSLGVKPRVNYLYSDLYNGLVIFQLMDFIRPGVVNWKRVKKEEQMSKIQAKKFQEILGNCNYAVEVGKTLNFVLVGIGGSDIYEGNRTLTLALVWQLMRAYTLSLLSKLNEEDSAPVEDKDIISWANAKLAEAGKSSSITSFQDKTNKTAIPIIDLVDAINKGSIDYSVVKTGSKLSSEECLSNAKYAVNMARKIGAPVYALPEDISEVKHKMVMTVYASLMLADMN